MTSGPREQHHQKILTILVKCQDNIVKEVAGKWNLNMEGLLRGCVQENIRPKRPG